VLRFSPRLISQTIAAVRRAQIRSRRLRDVAISPLPPSLSLSLSLVLWHSLSIAQIESHQTHVAHSTPVWRARGDNFATTEVFARACGASARERSAKRRNEQIGRTRATSWCLLIVSIKPLRLDPIKTKTLIPARRRRARFPLARPLLALTGTLRGCRA
jgi:hypothetical protein